MKRKNNLLKITAFFVCLLCLTSAIFAQKRRTPARKTTRPAAASATTVPAVAEATALELKDGAQKASTQLKSVTRFIYLLGGIAQGIEDVDADIKARKASPAAVDLNTRNKQGVIAALQKLRGDLVPVEIEFRAKPSLRNYVSQIGGISDIAGRAEDQAMAGQFKEAGKTLIEIANKLTDTLAAMP